MCMPSGSTYSADPAVNLCGSAMQALHILFTRAYERLLNGPHPAVTTRVPEKGALKQLLKQVRPFQGRLSSAADSAPADCVSQKLRCQPQ